MASTWLDFGTQVSAVYLTMQVGATHIGSQIRQRTLEQIISRKHPSYISNRGLEQTDDFVLVRLREVDGGNEIQNLVNNLGNLHDQGCTQGIDGAGAPASTADLSAANAGGRQHQDANLQSVIEGIIHGE